MENSLISHSSARRCLTRSEKKGTKTKAHLISRNFLQFLLASVSALQTLKRASSAFFFLIVFLFTTLSWSICSVRILLSFPHHFLFFLVGTSRVRAFVLLCFDFLFIFRFCRTSLYAWVSMYIGSYSWYVYAPVERIWIFASASLGCGSLAPKISLSVRVLTRCF